MTIYVEIKDNKVIASTSNIKIAQTAFENYIETEYEDYTPNNIKYIYDGEKIILNPDYEKEKEEQEKETINSLTLTNQELKNAFKIANKELTIPDIYQYQDFKRSDEFICSLPYIQEDLDYLFKYKSLPF